MDAQFIKNLQDRTDAKIDYAEVHLEELRALGVPSGSHFDRAHTESFLFHLLGAKDAFLMELNIYYDLCLPSTDLTDGKLRSALIKRDGETCAELAELFKTENDKNSWLYHAKTMRDHSTHVSGIARAFHAGGPKDGQTYLRNPKTGESIERHFVDEFTDWVLEMRKLLEGLRATALETGSIQGAKKL